MRKTYLDNIRWITAVLVVIYHVIYIFNGVTTFGIIGPFSDHQPQDVYQYIVYPWFMLLLFVVSGVSARFELDKRTAKEFMRIRTRKLLVPSTLGLLVFGWILGYYNMLMSGAFNEMNAVPAPVLFLIMAVSGCGPLWYIQMLWVFSVLLLLVRKIEKDRFYVYMAGPDMYLALKLGARIKIFRGFTCMMRQTKDGKPSQCLAYAVTNLVQDRMRAKIEYKDNPLVEKSLKTMVNRNNAGLVSRKEQERLAEELMGAQVLLSEANKKINMSNVEAVDAARAAQKATEQKAAEEIIAYKASADNRIADAINAKNTAIRQAKNKVKAVEKSCQIAWGSLIATLLCCLIVHPVFLEDIWFFISAPVIWVWGSLNDYAVWLEKPYYSKMIRGVEKLYAYSSGKAWILRILSFVVILICIAGACYGIYRLWLYYRKRWCNLTKRVSLTSLGAIIVFGETIHRYMNINLVLLFVSIQLAYLGILKYLDGYFDNRQRLDTWIRVQNS